MTTGLAAAIRKRLRADSVRDRSMMHPAGDAMISLGKTPIIDQVGKPCLTQTARQYVVEILNSRARSNGTLTPAVIENCSGV